MATAVKTEHPHIVRLEGVCGGEPVIDGLRVTVRHVAKLHQQGESVAEIADSLDLTEAQVFHALSFYSDHQDEINTLIAEGEKTRGEECHAAAGGDNERGELSAMEKIIARANALPEEIVLQWPTDGASQHDHYIYGTPKRTDLRDKPE